jgi:hypothetical protein
MEVEACVVEESSRWNAQLASLPARCQIMCASEEAVACSPEKQNILISRKQ